MFAEIADCFVHLDALLSDNAKVRLAVVSKSHLKFLQMFLYHKRMSVNSIRRLSYFDKFTCVTVDERTKIVPNNARYIQYYQRENDAKFPVLTATNGSIKNINEVFVRSAKTKIPDEVERVTFGNEFKAGIDRHFLPSNMKYFDTGISFNGSIAGCMPNGVKEMRIWCRNELTKNMIPDSVVSLQLGPMVNQPINGLLPPRLEVLEFCGCFDQPLENCLPNTLKKLTVGAQYIYPIDGCIPDSVIELYFSSSYNRPVSARTFPPHLEVLVFGVAFSHPVENYIPKTVKLLGFGDQFNGSIEHLPDLEYLSFGREFNRPIKGYIPKTTKILIFGREFNQSIEAAIPHGIIHLSFSVCFDQDIKGHIPNSVKILHLGGPFGDFNQSIEDAIPSSVEELRFGKYFCQPIKNYIPASVREVYFYGEMNPHIEEYIEKYISDSVKVLLVGSVFIRTNKN